MQNLRELITTMVIVILLIFTMSIPIIVLAYSFDNTSCYLRASAQNLKSEYGLFSGCTLILPNGKKVNEQNYRVL